MEPEYSEPTGSITLSEVKDIIASVLLSTEQMEASGIPEELDLPEELDPIFNPLLSTEYTELHLKGQHDQGSHGTGGGGGGSGSSGDKGSDSPGGGGVGIQRAGGPAKKVMTEEDYKKAEKTADDVHALLKRRPEQKELDKAEEDLEQVREKMYKEFDDALDKNDLKEAKKIYDGVEPVEKELSNVRKKLYTDDQRMELAQAEQLSRFFDQGVKNGDKVGIGVPKKFNDDILAGGKKFWNQEPGLLKKDFRGTPDPHKPHAVGSTLKNGEWPKKATPGSRDVKVIAKGSFFKSTEIDGLKVKAAYEVTTADGTKLRAYDLSSRRNKNTQQSLATAAYMHDLYPTKPPKTMVFLSGIQTAKMAGPGTNAFVYPGTDYVFMNKAASKIPPNSGWMMPAIKKDPSQAHYTATHEFGHQFDFTNQRRSSVGLFETPQIKRHLSTYGQYNSHEGYAEAFAEWHVSEGRTRNPAAVAYATHNNWYGSDKAGALAAGGKVSKMESYVITELAPEEWDPWVVARELGIISMVTVDPDDIGEDKDGEDEETFEGFPTNLPMIIDNFSTGKPELRNMKDHAASDIEKVEAEKVARAIYEDLGLEWNE